MLPVVNVYLKDTNRCLAGRQQVKRVLCMSFDRAPEVLDPTKPGIADC